MSHEFELIRRCFTHPVTHTLLGVGDDCALLPPVAAGKVIAISSDMLVEGRHFLTDTDPGRLGRKTAAVNLSDLAAMGARPRWATLSVSLPELDQRWVAAFSAGFHAMLQAHEVDWVGGDTTAGPLTLAVTILGEVDPGHALARHRARPGDRIWVSGTLGDAALGLRLLSAPESVGAGPTSEQREFCIGRLEMPQPRIALGLALCGVAHAAIDISDGLLGDLTHILDSSRVGARLELDQIPRSAALQTLLERESEAWRLVLQGGDDYELCFTAPAQQDEAIRNLARQLDLAVSCIGLITAEPERLVCDRQGRALPMAWHGFDHFQ